MEKILGIDFGKSKIGLAIGDTDSLLAEPLEVLRFNDIDWVIEKLRNRSKELGVSKIVVGISEGNIGDFTKDFTEKLKSKIDIPIYFQDETLTTHEAQALSIQAGINRKKRKGMEDAYAATLILQSYLDSF
jgi:putative Holliday junction resolvase